MVKNHCLNNAYICNKAYMEEIIITALLLCKRECSRKNRRIGFLNE